jgi:hypothetical protein
MNIVGFDLSLTAPGVATSDDPYTLPSTKKLGSARLSVRAVQVIDVLDTEQPSFVVLEGYAMGHTRNMAGARSVAELGGVVRLILHERGIASADVPPSVLKKYATGKGNAPKDHVIEAAITAGAHIPQRPARGGGREFDDNAADAWWLWQMGIARYAPSDPRLRAVPSVNRECLQSVKWPNIRKVTQ